MDHAQGGPSDEHFARCGRGFNLGHPAGFPAQDEMLHSVPGQARGGGPELPTVDANAHVETDAVAADPNGFELAVGSQHRGGRRNRPSSVILSAEQDQEGVAPELQVGTVVPTSDIEHAVKVLVDNTCEPLRPFLADLGKPFRHAGEARYIGKDEGTFEGIDPGWGSVRIAADGVKKGGRQVGHRSRPGGCI